MKVQNFDMNEEFSSQYMLLRAGNDSQRANQGQPEKAKRPERLPVELAFYNR